RAAGQLHGRLARRQVHDAYVAPENSARQTGPERLGAGFLGSKALGIGGRALLATVGLGALYIGEDAFDEALRVTLERRLDAPNVDQVAANADNHRFPLTR